MLRLLVAAVGSALAVALGLSNFGKFLVGSLEFVIKRSQHRCRIDSVRKLSNRSSFLLSRHLSNLVAVYMLSSI
jgi:hypothetical protein